MDYFSPIVFCFMVSFMAIKISKPLAVRFGLVDLPNERKFHKGAIPLVGGVGIYLGVLIASMIYFQDNQVFHIYLISAALILFLGVLDDKYDLSVGLRLVAQIIVASMMIFGAKFYLHSLGFIFGFFELKLGYLGILVTIVAVIGAINAFNMVDGIDGLAGMLSLVSFFVLSLLFYRANSDWYLLPLLFMAAICAYLVFNLSLLTSLGKIFMGDAGSMLIGLTIVWLLVIGTSPEVNAFKPVTALYIIAIPLMDMAAIMYRRVKKGVSPFQPDRNHLHHIFQRAGLSRRQTLGLITFLACVWGSIGFIAEAYMFPEWLMFAIFIVMFLAYAWCISHIWVVLRFFRRPKQDSETL